MNDAPAPPTGWRTLAWGALALGLVAVVAMEAHGAVWSDHRGAQPRALPHSVVVAGVVGLGLLAVAIFVAILTLRRASETPEQRRRRWTTAIGFLVAIVLISMLRLTFFSGSGHEPTNPAPVSPNFTATPGATGHHVPTTSWWPLVVVLLGTAVALAVATARRPRAERPDDATANETIELLDASLDDLRTEPDARRAVVAAYARMERGLAARGFARRDSETPTEYLRRALGTPEAAAEGVRAEPLATLTELSEWARFSPAPVDEAMRARAIAALESLRADLQAAARADAPTALGAEA